MPLRAQDQASIFQLQRDTSNSIPHSLSQLPQDFEHFSPSKWIVIGELYRQGNCALIYYLRVRVSVKGCNLRATTSAKPGRGTEFLLVAVFETDTDCPSECDMGEEEFVFVANIQAVKGEQVVPVPSHVRLYCVENVTPHSLSDLPFVQVALQAPFDLFLRLSERKFCKIRSLREEGEFNIAPGEIQRRAQIVKCVSQNESERLGREFLYRNSSRIAAGLQVVVDRDSMICLARCFPDLAIEGIHEFLATENLEDGIAGDHSPVTLDR